MPDSGISRPSESRKSDPLSRTLASTAAASSGESSLYKGRKSRSRFQRENAAKAAATAPATINMETICFQVSVSNIRLS
jgi:hypothetical protein